MSVPVVFIAVMIVISQLLGTNFVLDDQEEAMKYRLEDVPVCKDNLTPVPPSSWKLINVSHTSITFLAPPDAQHVNISGHRPHGRQEWSSKTVHIKVFNGHWAPYSFVGSDPVQMCRSVVDGYPCLICKRMIDGKFELLAYLNVNGPDGGPSEPLIAIVFEDPDTEEVAEMIIGSVIYVNPGEGWTGTP